MDPNDYHAWRGSGVAGTLKAFWSAVKAATGDDYGVDKIFMTGITPLLLSGNMIGFNISRNISFDPLFATVCGLTKDDVVATLRHFCKEDEEKVQKHLAELQKYANGYHFCNEESVPKVFNPETIMWYLDVIIVNQLVLNPVLISFSTQAKPETRPPLSMLRIPKSPWTP